jgi:hypothetical protein
MQEVNWHIFRAKFNGKETKVFESLCYLLFCREFGVSKTGIFRFKNQPGLETEPILFNGQSIGFQSKFFENTINRQDIEESIATTKKQYPNVTKVYVYLNLEFSKSSKDGKDPKFKTQIEEFAKSNSIEIEWRVPSHIEAQLALAENKTLAEYFFSLATGVLDAIEGLVEHTSAILKPISSEIGFNGSTIKIDRTQSLFRLTTALAKSPVVILSGVAGVGKTALIKDFQTILHSAAPLYIFKATEFNISHVNDLFQKYGSLSILEFVNEHENIDTKYVVIDSAEKLADLQNQDAFQEFLSTLLRHDWKIIFTTRYTYLDDLKFQFVDVYGLDFEPLVIENLEPDQLETLATHYGFTLPTNARFLELLRNPFYLDQYLQDYDASDASQLSVTLQSFKNRLWDSQIVNSSYHVNNIHIKREECFLNLAKARADSGGFFISEVTGCDDDALTSLGTDEIIERDSTTGRFFITHDIYEEWGLEKYIERAFVSAADRKVLFDSLGSSLAVRRAFRGWLSEKLFANRDEVKPLIEASLTDDDIQKHWKDEIVIAVLLSDHAETFFQMFEKDLLANEQEILMRVIFLLRIACKEIDESLLKLFGVSKRTVTMLSTVFTKPKGSGWSCVIKFLYTQRKNISDANTETILPLLEDWANRIQNGAATKFSGLLALYYYEAAHQNEKLGYRSLEQRKKQLVGIISNVSGEIKEELKQIFEEIISKKEIGYQTKYHELVTRVVSSATESYTIARNLPEQVLQLADLVWYDDPNRKRDRYEHHSTMVEVEARFCISATRIDYYPASAFQTPIFQLLQCSTKPTLDFILSFMNRTVGCYAKSEFRNELEEVEVIISPGETVKQYISPRLWNAYRGTQGSPHLLESIHMALERWLLEQAKTGSDSEIEEVCKYLIRSSRSASITSVVASVVLSQPYKLFNVATILFRTKEFFFYDSGRMTLDLSSSHFTFGTGFNFRHKVFEEERIKAAKDLHRKGSLEQLAFNYQFFKSEGESDEVAKERQQVMGRIFDDYYSKLSATGNETEREKTWRLYLARMDRRKMDAELKEQHGQTVVQFTPQIDPELKKFSEDSLKQNAEAMRYTSLFLWSQVRFRQEKDQYQQYRQYEDDPQTVIAETKRIRNEVAGADLETWSRSFNASIPGYTCAVLIRDFADQLSLDDRAFCKEVVLEFASKPLAVQHYFYQSMDGVEPAISSLPLLLKHFPDDHEAIKSLLLLLLVYRSPTEASNFAVRAILNYLWDISFEDAQSLFVGYLLLKPEYEKLWDEMRQEHYHDLEFAEFSNEAVLRRFLETHESPAEDVIANRIRFDDLRHLESIELETLNTAFQLLPLGTTESTHDRFVRKVFPVFADRVFDDGEDKLDYELKHNLLDKLAFFVLKAPTDRVASYIKPFVDGFRVSRDTSNLFARFVSAEDVLDRYDEFWIVWNAFYQTIVALCKDGRSRYDAPSIIHNYLFAWPYWKQTAKEWHTLREREKTFFQSVARDMGHDPAVLYSLAKVLNEIGSTFFEEGIIWISGVLQNSSELETGELEEDTVYYLENLVRKYILLKRSAIRSVKQTKDQVLLILNFLVERGSVVGYLLREDVL